jgi:hypothetical protein
MVTEKEPNSSCPSTLYFVALRISWDMFRSESCSNLIVFNANYPSKKLLASETAFCYH